MSNETAGDKAVARTFSPLSDEQKADMDAVKNAAARFYDTVHAMEAKYGRKRGFSLAKTELETASMWAVKAIANPDL